MHLVFDWKFSINFMTFDQVKIEIYLVFYSNVRRRISNSSMILSLCLPMTFSTRDEATFRTLMSVFFRLKLVKIEYVEWKKKIDDGLKQINSLNDEQIVKQYKPFYAVRRRKTKSLSNCFLFSSSNQVPNSIRYLIHY